MHTNLSNIYINRVDALYISLYLSFCSPLPRGGSRPGLTPNDFAIRTNLPVTNDAIIMLESSPPLMIKLLLKGDITQPTAAVCSLCVYLYAEMKIKCLIITMNLCVSLAFGNGGVRRTTEKFIFTQWNSIGLGQCSTFVAHTTVGVAFGVQMPENLKPLQIVIWTNINNDNMNKQ